MRALIWVLGILFTLVPAKPAPVVVIPPMPQHIPTAEYYEEALEWGLYWHEAFEEYEDAFTAHFNSLTYKRSANGRSMVNGKFVKMGA